jgi:enoyl-CoA hydratase/carnithine racemase
MSIDVEVRDAIATIVINRPERMNALDADHLPRPLPGLDARAR